MPASASSNLTSRGFAWFGLIHFRDRKQRHLASLALIGALGYVPGAARLGIGRLSLVLIISRQGAAHGQAQIVQLRLLWGHYSSSSRMKYARARSRCKRCAFFCSASAISSLRCPVRSADISRRRRRFGGFPRESEPVFLKHHHHLPSSTPLCLLATENLCTRHSLAEYR